MLRLLDDPACTPSMRPGHVRVSSEDWGDGDRPMVWQMFMKDQPTQRFCSAMRAR